MAALPQNNFLWCSCREAECQPSSDPVQPWCCSLLRVLTEMGCSRGQFTERYLQKEDVIRVKKASKKVTVAEKERRKLRRRRQKGIEEQRLDEEGPTYAAGGF